MGYWNDKEVGFNILEGKTINKVDGLTEGSDDVLFHMSDGQSYHMYHEQDCCESVSIEDINGDVEDLIGQRVLLAYENHRDDKAPPEDPDEKDYYCDESETWTFYRIQTPKGLVVIRWLGQSNGYYSESVDFRLVVAEEDEA